MVGLLASPTRRQERTLSQQSETLLKTGGKSREGRGRRGEGGGEGGEEGREEGGERGGEERREVRGRRGGKGETEGYT